MSHSRLIGITQSWTSDAVCTAQLIDELGHTLSVNQDISVCQRLTRVSCLFCCMAGTLHSVQTGYAQLPKALRIAGVCPSLLVSFCWFTFGTDLQVPGVQESNCLSRCKIWYHLAHTPLEVLLTV